MDQSSQYEYKSLTARLTDSELNKVMDWGWELVSAKRRTLPFIGAPTDYIFRKVKGSGSYFPKITLGYVSPKTTAKWVLGILAGGFVFLIILIAILVNIPQETTNTPDVSSISTDSTTTSPVQNTDNHKNIDAQKTDELAAWQKTPAGQLCLDHPTWSRTNCQAVVDKNIVLGMNEAQITLVLGQPNHTVTSQDTYIGTSDLWTYNNISPKKNLYFVNGILHSIQNW